MQNVGLEWTLIDTWVTIGEVSASPSGGAIIPATIKVYSKNKAGTSALYLMDDAGSEREIAPPNTVTGTGTANRLAYWTGTSTIAANAALTQHRILVADANGLPANNAALTSTRVPFADANGELTDVANLNYDTTNGTFYIGATTSPNSTVANRGFVLTKAGAITECALYGFGNGGQGVAFRGSVARGTLASPTQALSGDNIAIAAMGHDNSTGWATLVRIDLQAAEDITTTNQGSLIIFNTKAIGSTTLAERLRITDTTLQPGTSLVMNLGTSALRFLRLWGGDVEMADQAAPSAPASGNAVLFSFNQQGFSVLHVTDSTNAQIEIARDNYVVAKNTSGVTINKGEAVYITGATGNVPNVAKAKADSLTTLPAVGIMFETTTNNSFGRVMYAGNVENFDTSAFTAGDKLWVSTVTAGALTNTRPTPSSTSFPQHIASVLTSGVGNGSIYCNANDVEGVIASDTDPLSQYFLLAGRSGGQVAIGGTAAGDDLTLKSTSNATKGQIFLGSSGNSYKDESNGSWTLAETISTSISGFVGMTLGPSFSGSGDFPQGVKFFPSFTPSASLTTVFGFLGVGQYGPPTAVTITNAYSAFDRSDYLDTAGAVTVGVAHYIAEPTIFGALKPASQYGLVIKNQGASGMTNAIGLSIDGQSGATNNYVFSLPADATDPTGGGGAATGRIPCLIGGALRYIPYY